MLHEVEKYDKRQALKEKAVKRDVARDMKSPLLSDLVVNRAIFDIVICAL